MALPTFKTFLLFTLKQTRWIQTRSTCIYSSLSRSSGEHEEYQDKTTMGAVHGCICNACGGACSQLQDSVKGHRELNRNGAQGHLMLVNDYFTSMRYSSSISCHYFQMWRLVFHRLYHGVRAYGDYFILKKDAIGTIEFAGYQKCSTAMGMFAMTQP